MVETGLLRLVWCMGESPQKAALLARLTGSVVYKGKPGRVGPSIPRVQAGCHGTPRPRCSWTRQLWPGGPASLHNQLGQQELELAPLHDPL